MNFLFAVQWLLLLKTSQGEVFSSVSDMQRVFKLERDLVNVMLEFAQKTERKLNRIKKYLSDYSSTLDEFPEDLDIEKKVAKLAGNPIHTYNVVRRLSVDFANIEQELRVDQWKEHEQEVQKLRLGGVVPKEKDLHGAAQALIRLQDVYELDISNLADGKIGPRETAAKLSAQDCLFIGKHCFNAGILSRSIEWFEEAWHLAGEENNSTVSQDQVRQFLDHAAKEHDERVLRGEKSGNLFPRPVYQEAPQGQRTKMITRQTKIARNDTDLSNLDFQDDSFNFGSLCRGKEMRKGRAARLTCRYDHRDQPLFFLQPTKVEMVHDSPEILLFHDIVSKAEQEEIKALGKPLLSRSPVLGGMGGSNEVSATRTSKTGWLDDKQHETVLRLGRRVAMATGLNTDTAEDDAEMLQVANYMNGGHYSPHFDYVMKEKSPDHMIYLPGDNLYIGDRLATWMFYLSEVGEGGRTVFPRIGAGVKPEAGSAVFWYNLLEDGSANKLTLHGACPVLYGTKWVGNKWIREGSHLFKKPCPLHQIKPGTFKT